MNHVLAAAVLALSSLTACQSGFSGIQRDRLRDNGFQPSGTDWMLGVSERLLFPFDSSRIDAAQARHIRKMGRSLVEVGIGGAEVRGHADALGSPAYNEMLSFRRADAVRGALIDGGMKPSAVRVVGLGASDPIARNDTSAGRHQNRRVVIVVSSRDVAGKKSR